MSALRLRVAWNVLRGRQTAYRMHFLGEIKDTIHFPKDSRGYVAECTFHTAGRLKDEV